jgi:hypothetical protein
MAKLYVNENAVYAFKNEEGFWVFSKNKFDEQSFIIKSTNAVEKPYETTTYVKNNGDQETISSSKEVVNAEKFVLLKNTIVSEANSLTAQTNAEVVNELSDKYNSLTLTLKSIIG